MRVVPLFFIQWICVFSCCADNGTNYSTDGANIYQSLALLESHLKHSAQDGASRSLEHRLLYDS